MDANQIGYNTLDQAIAAEVRAEFARQRQTKSLTELSSLLHVHRTNLSARVSGRTAFTAGELKKVADYLQTTPDELIQEAVRRLGSMPRVEGVA
ncbi:helix-turn-helix transcriptional regulator [Actinobaculum sp. 352]|uniref:helix-turn-helix domain-containing protein n=1 Tax=Actinobaculum sp. 352 TaxID=2490946 RepID=UPI000F7F05EF|nr:helix-turn-helix transcriptional regulator [Actinobaculum sp. 352]RTE49611.1 XRE family transcriptional regulator [Actinobaculum sp. 352]